MIIVLSVSARIHLDWNLLAYSIVVDPKRTTRKSAQSISSAPSISSAHCRLHRRFFDSLHRPSSWRNSYT
ncbi:hypothetical protein AMS68_003115 [Peltaster fructicola]|uniref:Uncharacterized protein n=1 Tax=Peltaster fructicola TaxID=286661 RepID=A0A6H0XSK0_9PEZI|nr:hypothetical protein AMS68_003115 [Peltaster fructicola]